MTTINKTYLGTGWSFPPSFDRQRKAVDMVSDVKDIQQSLIILLTTQLGERVMNHEYGAGMEAMLFEPLDTNMKTYMTELVKNAVLRYEPRIDLEEVEMNDAGEFAGRIDITVHFTVRSTNSRANVVFPYYKVEGTNI